MANRANRPSALASTPGLAPQPQVDISDDNSRVSARLPTGESCEILLYGATVISWKTANQREKLWLSDAAKLDGSKAVRGGIPLVFPVFGTDPSHPPTSALPQHGFARISTWEYLGRSTSESAQSLENSGVKLDFGLSPSNLPEAARSAWPAKFGLIYSVTLSRDGLETSMLVRNEGDEPWVFQFLMHSYFRVGDISAVGVEGLSGAAYIDKVPTPSNKTEAEKIVRIAGEVDRVYTPQGGPSTPLVVREGEEVVLVIQRDNLDNAVVWNPWVEKSKGMGDFEPKDGYKQMICVEAGQVGGWTRLDAGDTFEGGQFIKSSL